ncbi:hypothetical protein HELRODRAFT_174270 [Helobdella robusta]|uniref:Uncharacterized protein n=1 Tax=Helobdella robusta TaxID=6412 RepID=T1F7X1_HELRO|nr:hypothetical protein HELRODRAFT_174270 [Helobdella robusta]ESO02841.1 hypothetical protein HELRODRAFT_174270 [Helobdella robusta]
MAPQKKINYAELCDLVRGLEQKPKKRQRQYAFQYLCNRFPGLIYAKVKEPQIRDRMADDHFEDILSPTGKEAWVAFKVDGVHRCWQTIIGPFNVICQLINIRERAIEDPAETDFQAGFEKGSQVSSEV